MVAVCGSVPAAAPRQGRDYKPKKSPATAECRPTGAAQQATETKKSRTGRKRLARAEAFRIIAGLLRRPVNLPATMKRTAAVFLLAAAASSLSTASAAIISWTMSPAVDASEVNNVGIAEWGYAFHASNTGEITVNGVSFEYRNVGGPGGPMADANLSTPGFVRAGPTSYGEASTAGDPAADFYQGPSAELNQLLDGLTWGGTREFQLTGLNPGDTYTVQLFSSDDRTTQANRVLDIDSSWATPNGSRQIENIDYTGGGPWTDPAGRSKIFTGTFTADATTQDILAALIEPPGTGDGGGQIDLNAIQLRIIPEPASALLITGLASLCCAFRRRR
jgi:hypothetical protein